MRVPHMIYLQALVQVHCVVCFLDPQSFCDLPLVLMFLSAHYLSIIIMMPSVVVFCMDCNAVVWLFQSDGPLMFLVMCLKCSAWFPRCKTYIEETSRTVYALYTTPFTFSGIGWSLTSINMLLRVLCD